MLICVISEATTFHSLSLSPSGNSPSPPSLFITSFSDPLWVWPEGSRPVPITGLRQGLPGYNPQETGNFVIPAPPTATA